MSSSQYLMLIALSLIVIAAVAAWVRGHRNSQLQRVFAALTVQALAAVGLSFSTEDLGVSLLLGAVILTAVGWMVRSAGRMNSAAS